VRNPGINWWKLIHSAALKPRHLGRGQIAPPSVSILSKRQPLSCGVEGLMPQKEAELVCAASVRGQGNMSLFYGDTRDSLKNREAFLKELGIDYRDLACARQVHQASARYIQDKDKGRGALSEKDAFCDTDALVTDKKNLALAIFTADCLSVFLYDPKRPAVGLAHAGWRGTKDNIAAKAIKLMQRQFNTPAQDLHVAFGPAIRSCCYQVSGDFAGIFPDGIINRDNHYYLDLAGINRKQVLAAGVKEENLFDSRDCTFCQNSNFFSYRKEGADCGRMMSVIMLK